MPNFIVKDLFKLIISYVGKDKGLYTILWPNVYENVIGSCIFCGYKLATISKMNLQINLEKKDILWFCSLDCKLQFIMRYTFHFEKLINISNFKGFEYIKLLYLIWKELIMNPVQCKKIKTKYIDRITNKLTLWYPNWIYHQNILFDKNNSIMIIG